MQLVRDEALEDVIAQRVAHELARARHLDRLVEVVGQRVEADGLTLVGGHLVDVGLDRGRQLVLVLDALEAGGEHDGEGQVGVGGRVGVAQLGAHGALFALHVERHADERGAVAVRPRDVDRRLVARAPGA